MYKLRTRLCSLLCVIVMCITLFLPHVRIKAAEVVVGVTAWEILETIMLSLGVTISVQESNLVDEVCQEVVDTYNLWVESNGFDKDFAKLKTDLTELVQTGTDRTIQIADECWDGLRAWVKSLSNNETYICDTFTYGFNRVANCMYAVPFYYVGGLQLVSGNINVNFVNECKNYGMVSYAYGNDYVREIVIYSDEPFSCYITDSYSSEWISEPSSDEYLSYLVSKSPTTTLVDSEEYVGSYNVGGEMYESDSIYYIAYSTFAGKYKELTCNLGCIDLHDCNYSNALTSALCRIMYNFNHKDNTLSYDVVGGSAVESGAWDIITRGRTWEDDEVKGDVVITVPDDVASDIVRVGSGESTISDVISVGDSIAIPVDTTADTAIDYPWTITDTIDYVNTIDDDGVIDDDVTDTDTDEVIDPSLVPSIAEDAGDWKTLFPFCIPWDIMHLVKSMQADKEAPRFTFKYTFEVINYTWVVDVDMSDYWKYIKIFRWGMTIFFIIGLFFLTVKFTTFISRSGT